MTEHDTKRMSAWVDGELPPEQVNRVVEHLSQCADCAEFVEELRGVRSSLLLATQTEADPAFLSRFRERRDALSVAPWWTWRQFALRLAPVAIVVLLLAIATTFLAPVEQGGLRELEREALGDPTGLGGATLQNQEPVLRIALEPFPEELP